MLNQLWENISVMHKPGARPRRPEPDREASKLNWEQWREWTLWSVAHRKQTRPGAPGDFQSGTGGTRDKAVLVPGRNGAGPFRRRRDYDDRRRKAGPMQDRVRAAKEILHRGGQPGRRPAANGTLSGGRRNSLTNRGIRPPDKDQAGTSRIPAARIPWRKSSPCGRTTASLC